MLDAEILLFILTAMAAPFVLGPPVVWAVVRNRAVPDVTEVSRDALSPPVDALVDQGTVAMLVLGFTPLPLFRFEGTKGTYAYVSSFRHPRTRDSGSVVVFMRGSSGNETVVLSYVEFGYHQEDGMKFTTQNSKLPGSFAPVPDHRITRLPSVQDVGLLFRCHRAVVEQRGFHQAKEELEDPLQEIRDVTLHQLKQQETAGYFQSTADGAAFRPTIKGALIMTWMQCFPVKQVREAMIVRESKRLVARVLRSSARPPSGIPTPG